MVDDSSHTAYTGHYNTAGNRYATTLWGLFAESGQQSNNTYCYFGQYTDCLLYTSPSPRD